MRLGCKAIYFARFEGFCIRTFWGRSVGEFVSRDGIRCCATTNFVQRYGIRDEVCKRVEFCSRALRDEAVKAGGFGKWCVHNGEGFAFWESGIGCEERGSSSERVGYR